MTERHRVQKKFTVKFKDTQYIQSYTLGHPASLRGEIRRDCPTDMRTARKPQSVQRQRGDTDFKHHLKYFFGLNMMIENNYVFIYPMFYHQEKIEESKERLRVN